MMLNRSCVELDRLVDRFRSGRGGSLVVRGEAGTGKTRLLDQAVERAPECRIVRVAGVESERELALAAMLQLCEPLLDDLEGLPLPQADALRTAFGLRTASFPDRLLLGLAVRSLFARAAEQQPLICVVEDAQWLDGPSARLLAFVARRLDPLPVGLVFATRERREEFVGLADVEVEGLSELEARLLIDTAIPGACDEEVRARIVAETAGNPVEIIELLTSLRPAHIASGYGAPNSFPLPAPMARSFSSRLERLPADARTLLLVAAAEPLGRPDLLWRAADQLGIPAVAVVRCQDDGFLRLDGGLVRFRHPAMRSAVYGEATPTERRQVHRALAAAADPQSEGERHAWHRAEATSVPTEELAAALQQLAYQAQDKGGFAAKAALLDRAAALTPDAARRSRRLLAAGQAKLAAGVPDQALALLAGIDCQLLEEPGCSQLEQLVARAVAAQRGGPDAPAVLLRTAKRLRALDAELARDTYLDAFEAAMQTGGVDSDSTVALAASDVGTVLPAAAAQPTAPPAVAAAPKTRQAVDFLLDGLASLFAEDYPSAVPALRVALRELSLRADNRWLSLGATVASDLWDDRTSRALATRQRESALRAGALGGLHPSLGMLAQSSILAGGFAEASDLIEQAGPAASDPANVSLRCAELMLAAFRGPQARQLLEDEISQGQGRLVAFAHEMRAVLENSLGNYREALTAAESAVTYRQVGASDRAMAELVEAAARCGERQTGEVVLQRLSQRTQLCGTDWALGIEARSRALLSEGQAADQLYQTAIERLARSSVSTALARAHLVYGEWLRREGTRMQARIQLRTALEMFRAMGALAFAERAERELLATGERVRRPEDALGIHLTSQEAHISQLARDGHSNSDIAAKLFLSPRTVEYHLRKVFKKLAISSRNELHRALPASGARTWGPALEARSGQGELELRRSGT
jgi:DNA-binding CsgD family transcriptional regulator